MDTRTIATLMDIQTLQMLGASRNDSNTNNQSSLFNILLEELSGDFSVSNTSLPTSDMNYTKLTEGLHYNGANQVFIPSSLIASLGISQKKDIPTVQNKAFEVNDYTELITKAAAQYNLPEKLISSVIKQESNFNNEVVSQAGAQGLMQLMPGTAKFLGVTDSFDPAQNIMGGAKYLRQMLDQFDGDVEMALAAYNAGPGNVKKHNGIPPFQETQQYVQKVLGYFNA